MALVAFFLPPLLWSLSQRVCCQRIRESVREFRLSSSLLLPPSSPPVTSPCCPGRPLCIWHCYVCVCDSHNRRPRPPNRADFRPTQQPCTVGRHSPSRLSGLRESKFLQTPPASPLVSTTQRRRKMCATSYFNLTQKVPIVRGHTLSMVYNGRLITAVYGILDFLRIS